MPADLSLLRSPKVIIGGVLLLVMGTACACSNLDDDDDCDSLGPSETVLAASHSGLVGQRPNAEIFAAGSSGVRMAPPAPSDLAAVPANGGFGTHLASCGG